MVNVDAEYDVYRGRHTGTKRSEVTAEGLAALKEHADALSTKYALSTLLAAVGYKQGALISGRFPDDASIDRFTETLNDMGVTCAVDRPALESDRERTKIFMTRDISYTREDFEEISRLKEEDMAAYHRALGDFFGYPKTDIESFVERGRTPDEELEELGYQTGVVTRDGADGEPEIVWAPGTRTSVLNAYMPAADPGALKEYERRADTRFRAVKAIEEVYGVDLHDLLERRAEEERSKMPVGEKR